MNKFSTTCFTLLLSFATVATSTFRAVAIGSTASHSHPLLIAEGSNSYRVNWERAINKGIINRPSKVPDSETAFRMFSDAVKDNDDYNATRRLSQYMVIYSEKYGADAALQEEARIDRMMKRKTGKDLRTKYPLFNSIFPDNSNNYAADAP